MYTLLIIFHKCAGVSFVVEGCLPVALLSSDACETPIKYEVKGKIKEIINNKCQEVWNCDRHIYNIEQQVGNVRSVFRNRKEDTIINHIHIVHCVY